MLKFLPERVLRMSKYRLTFAARQDLREISRYIEERNPQAAIRVLLRIETQLSLLGENPMLGEAWDHNIPGLRRFSLKGNYVGFFRPLADGIEVVRILHGARDADALIDD